MKKKSIRVGVRVSSIYEPERLFLLDRSVMAETMFREKGTQNWFRKSELRAFCGAEKAASRGNRGILKRAAHLRSLAFSAIPAALGSKSKPVYERTCLECRTEFTTKHRSQKFHADACRTRFWKRRKELPKVPARLRSERVA